MPQDQLYSWEKRKWMAMLGLNYVRANSDSNILCEEESYYVSPRPVRKFKDTIFNLLFNKPEEALQLFNALNGTDYKDASALRIMTLEAGLYLGYKNDVAFMVADRLNLYEHQSTENANMPLRGLLYFTEEYQRLIDEQKMNLYGEKLLFLPLPRYIVLCNAADMKEEKKVLRLSDAYRIKGDASLECTAIVYNINAGHNKEIMEGCRTLSEYAELIRRQRESYKAGTELTASIAEAIDSCIRDNILKEFLLGNRKGVIGMLLEEYDEEKQRELDRRDNFEDGKIEGKAEDLLMFLSEIGELSESTREKIITEKDEDKLTGWLKMAFHSETIDEFRKQAGI